MNRFERKTQVLASIEGRLQGLESDTTQVFPSTEGLANEFSYSMRGMQAILHEVDFVSRLATIRSRRIEEGLTTPSQDLAWMLGFISAHFDPFEERADQRIRVRILDDALREKIRELQERFFPTFSSTNADSMAVQKDEVSFSVSDLSPLIAGSTSRNFADTLRNKYSWIMTEENLWYFIGGFWETKGTPRIRTEHGAEIVIPTRNRHIARLLREMLIRAGIRQKNHESEPIEEEPLLITITNLEDVQKFAKHIHIYGSKKNKSLEELLELSPRKASDANVIREWYRLYKLGNRPPSTRLIDQEETAAYSQEIFAYRFGDGSFVKASNLLNQIVPLMEVFLEEKPEMTEEEIDLLKRIVFSPQRNEESSVELANAIRSAALALKEATTEGTISSEDNQDYFLEISTSLELLHNSQTIEELKKRTDDLEAIMVSPENIERKRLAILRAALKNLYAKKK